MEDEELVEKAKQKDMRSYELLVDRYSEKILNFVYRFINDKYEAEEIAQDVFIHAFFKLDSYNSAKAKFSTWLYKIAYNLSVNYMKSKRARVLRETENYDRIPRKDESIDIERDAARNELTEAIKTGLDALPLKYRTALSLYYIEGMSYEEVKNIMNIPLNTVRTYMRRGKLLLRKNLLQKYGKA